MDASEEPAPREKAREIYRKGWEAGARVDLVIPRGLSSWAADIFEDGWFDRKDGRWDPPAYD